MTITTLSFDLDDTLWDPRAALIAGNKAQWQRLKQRFPHRLEHINRNRILDCRTRIIESSPEIVGDVTALRLDVMKQLLVDVGVPVGEAIEAATDAFSHFMAHRNDVTLLPDAAEILAQLAVDFQIIAITNGNADVQQTALGQFFAFSLRADEAGVAKPDPKIFDLALARAGCKASELLHIGDSLESDVQGANKSGIQPIWFNPKGKKNVLGVAEVSALADLPALINQLSG